MTPGLAIAAAPVADVQLGAGASLSSLGQLAPTADVAGFERALAGAVQRLAPSESPAQAMPQIKALLQQGTHEPSDWDGCLRHLREIVS